jgi:hypothetical protein
MMSMSISDLVDIACKLKFWGDSDLDGRVGRFCVREIGELA